MGLAPQKQIQDNRKWPGNRIGYGRKIGYRAPAENGLFIITGSLRSTQASQLPSTGRVMPLDMFPLTVAEKTQSAAASRGRFPLRQDRIGRPGRRGPRS